MSENKFVVIIPARGGSKGILNKNLKELLGKPLIAYSIECAIHSKYVDRVIVSTDSLEIAEISKKYGAEVPFLRPSELATDNSPVIDTFIYTIERLERDNGVPINHFIVLQPTSPLRTTKDLDEAIELFISKDADSVVSYTPEEHPIYWHKYLNKEGKLEDFMPSSISRRQDYRKTYYPNGAIYIFKKALILQRNYYSENTYAYIMPRNRSVDIDYQEDFDYIEYLMSNNKV
jgi:N-acylneuraminate cytidylyltransferase/CMP-N,N'-diacetyllegionaminic acid synthase